jgi:hypothetical protein
LIAVSDERKATLHSQVQQHNRCEVSLSAQVVAVISLQRL